MTGTVVVMVSTSRSTDVLIVGAGLSGISAACHLVRGCLEKRIATDHADDRPAPATWLLPLEAALACARFDRGRGTLVERCRACVGAMHDLPVVGDEPGITRDRQPFAVLRSSNGLTSGAPE